MWICYPVADAKAQVLRRERQCGGLTATALVTAARLGARCAYAGALGEDDLSRFVLDRFSREGVDTRWLVRHPTARPVASTIVVDSQRGTRNIFFDLSGSFGASITGPPEEVIRSCRVLLVDHFGVDGMIRAARIARGAGIPVLADFERDQVPRFDELLGLVDHLVLSRGFVRGRTGGERPRAGVAPFIRNAPCLCGDHLWGSRLLLQSEWRAHGAYAGVSGRGGGHDGVWRCVSWRLRGGSGAGGWFARAGSVCLGGFRPEGDAEWGAGRDPDPFLSGGVSRPGERCRTHVNSALSAWFRTWLVGVW